MSKRVLIKPIISEKATKLSEDLNQYGFIVGRNANKIEIRNAIEDMYGVTVERVNTLTMPAKHKQRFTKRGVLSGKTNVVKKAMVTLTEGDTIDFFEDV